MKILINAINLTSAGTATTARAFFETLASVDFGHEFVIAIPKSGKLRVSCESERIIWVEYGTASGIKNAIWRLWFDFIECPRLASRFSVNAVFALGNHLPGRYDVPGVVLFRNPHYVEPDRVLPPGKRLEKLLFRVTVLRRPRFIAQTALMKDRLQKQFSIDPVSVCVIPNGTERSSLVPANVRTLKAGKTFRLLYVSRYYPHKNHQFLIRLALRWKQRDLGDLEIRCTLNASTPAVQDLLSTVRISDVDDIFETLGELPAEQLDTEYESADAFIFPSMMETFGNPLVEAMGHGLPVMVADLPYAREICDGAAQYFLLDSVDEAIESILLLKQSAEAYAEASRQSLEQAKQFPSWEQVAGEYLQLISDRASVQGHDS